jgi:hypothetical protein
VFCNAQGLVNDAVCTSGEVSKDLSSARLEYHHPPLNSWEVKGDYSSCDAEYWACVVPYSVFKTFFQDFGKGSPVLKHPYCDLLFCQYIRDNGFIDVTEVVENGGKFPVNDRMSQLWNYCHLADERGSKPSDDIIAMTPSTVSVFMSLSPRERTIERLEQRLGKGGMRPQTIPVDIIKKVVQRYNVEHILGELVQSITT